MTRSETLSGPSSLVSENLETSSLKDEVSEENENTVWVAVIGAGIAGLAAALHLLDLSDQQDKKVNVIVFEASDRVGGRIWTHEKDDCFLELGAQWLHGQQGNPLFDFCNKHRLLSEDELDVGDERSGQYRTQDNELISQEIVDLVLDHLDSVKSSSPQSSASCVAYLLEDQLHLFLSENKTLDDRIIRGIYEWFLLFEVIDNACPDLKHLSCRGYSEWVDCPGTKLLNFKTGYFSVVQKLLENDTSKKMMLKMKNQVSKIEWEVEKRVNIFVGKEVITVDHVILTVSLGVLKAETITFFPRLPDAHNQFIQSNGYGTIDKIFLRFRHPFWKEQKYSLKLIWTDKKKQARFPEWVSDISGFDAVRGTNDMLMAWIGGKGAETVESIPESDVGRTCFHILKMFTGLDVEEPCEVLMSKWYTNPLFRGSYSHPTVASDQLKSRELTPLMSRSSSGKFIPRVFFAGEATDKEFYSSTHGAYRSGIRAANELSSWCTRSNREN